MDKAMGTALCGYCRGMYITTITATRCGHGCGYATGMYITTITATAVVSVTYTVTVTF